ncbi:CinA domain protein [Thiorhodococcus drewsii AZ1]|uniref:CinA domain protein n=1 Tax=Thiorhodococcus drewsii AZ1 TaxID=765913 RepID=G2E2V4_9GAMM|nr:nicotinamide-nucleotide amidase [Thiorhodococcus drewsii]EGV30658.1 CinA domain protein [Thiorhodococcus drewsii AZ1]
MIEQSTDLGFETIAARIGERLTARALMLACAESCTGGWIAKCVTDVAGSSAWFDRGFVTYSNAAKQEMLGVREETLARHGAVSEAVVMEMVAGALGRSRAQVALAVSGIAGPGGGTQEKPVGTVWIAWGVPGEGVLADCCRFGGDREAVRRETVRVALQRLFDLLAAHG